MSAGIRIRIRMKPSEGPWGSVKADDFDCDCDWVKSLEDWAMLSSYRNSIKCCPIAMHQRLTTPLFLSWTIIALCDVREYSRNRYVALLKCNMPSGAGCAAPHTLLSGCRLQSRVAIKNLFFSIMRKFAPNWLNNTKVCVGICGAHNWKVSQRVAAANPLWDSCVKIAASWSGCCCWNWDRFLWRVLNTCDWRNCCTCFCNRCCCCCWYVSDQFCYSLATAGGGVTKLDLKLTWATEFAWKNEK